MSPQLLSDIEDDDLAFDHRLPDAMRAKSSIHFTPLAVARCAARLLAPRPGMRVLDVGCGPGKFCMIAAREVPSCTFVGVELRPHLVSVARQIAAASAVPNTVFLAGDALDLDWSEYDAFYFYNPFGEQVHETAFVFDRTLDLSPSNFVAYVLAVRQRLASARVGTRVVTYHGMGGPPPHGYELREVQAIGTDYLELWIKTQEHCATGAEMESPLE